MKITKQYLKQVIKEELQRVMEVDAPPAPPAAPTNSPLEMAKKHAEGIKQRGGDRNDLFTFSGMINKLATKQQLSGEYLDAYNGFIQANPTAKAMLDSANDSTFNKLMKGAVSALQNNLSP